MGPFFPVLFASNMLDSFEINRRMTVRNRQSPSKNAKEMSPMRKIILPLFIAGLLAGCGHSGNGVDLISTGSRTDAPEIQADFLNLFAPTPTPLTGKKSKKKSTAALETAPTLTLRQLKGKVVILDLD